MACADCISHQIASPELVERLTNAMGQFPIAGSIELTLRCNVRCKHCYILYPGATSGEMSTAEVKDILNKLAERGVLFLLVSGGEIFARCDFKEIYLHAKKLGFLLTLFTNATLIDEAMADFLAKWPPRRVEITIYGHTEETYENVTGVRGSFKRFRNGVKLLIDRGIHVNLKTIVLQTNAHEFEDIRNWVKELGVPFRFDTMVNPKLNGDKAPLAERIDPMEIVQLEQSSGGMSREHMEKLTALALAHPRDRKVFTCGAGIRTFHVDPRGQVHPCMMWRKSPYDLKNGSLDGWADHINNLRENTLAPEDSGCRTCRHHLSCNNCAATAVLENDEPGTPVSYFCRINNTRERYLKLSRFGVPSDSTSDAVSA